MVVPGDGSAVGAPLRPSDPTRLGRYGVLRRLGEGGMGTVYLGRSETGRLVAIKVIRVDYARQDEFRARFRREAVNARRVARFCTAEVLDADPDAELPYLVTEYVEGSTLASVVAEQGPLSSANLERLAVGVAAALTAIHGAGVVHRDLKPSNVLLSPFGPRVIDFGVARAADATVGVSQDLRRMGTPAFMPPEQVRGEPVGPAADVFAWGGVVAFAGTGRYPFGEGPLPVLLYRILSEEPWLSGLDDSLRPIVARALGKDPARRPTATELLMSLLGGSASATDPRPAVHQALRGWEQPGVEAPTRVVPVGPFGGPTGPPPPPFGGPAGAPFGGPRPPERRPPGPERPRRRRGWSRWRSGASSRWRPARWPSPSCSPAAAPVHRCPARPPRPRRPCPRRPRPARP